MRVNAPDSPLRGHAAHSRTTQRSLPHSHQPYIRVALGHESNEIADLRVDRFAEFAPAENAVMAEIFRQQMFALFRRNVTGQCLRSFSLAIAGNIVQFAFD